MSNTLPALSAGQRAALFAQLQQLESAGLPAFQAFAALAKFEPRLKTPLLLMQRHLKSGRAISEAGYRAGIFDDTQQALIQAAEASGRLAEVYGQLAGYYSGLSARIQKVRSRLWLPALVLAMALFVQPLPALVGSQISLGGYLQLGLGRLVVISIAVFLLVRLPGMLRSLGAGAAWDRLLLGVPVVAQRIVERQLNGFFYVLAMLLESGLAFAEAFPKAVATIRNEALRKHFAPALAMPDSGASVADTLAEVSVIGAAMLQVVHSSEQSGKLVSGIMQFAQLEAETHNLQDDALAAWLPRVFYVLVAGWMAYSILGSQLGAGTAMLQ